MKNKAALYLRVSTNEQTTENQRLALQKIAEAKGYEITQVYEDKGFSGTLGKDQRPALKQMLKDATAREFDVLMVWSADRLGRSTSHVATIMEELNHLGVSQYYHMQGVDTSSPYGQAMIEMAAVFAKLERAMIVERVNAGLVRAKAEGKVLGRPKAITQVKAKAILRAHKKGDSIRKIANEQGLSVGSVHSVVKSGVGA
jgi:DNA invertase Pin-like site-specific DNA recombinase